jgi:hypothetical protein
VTLNGFLSLAWQSVTNPRDVARILLSTRLGGEALMTAFALVVVLNGLIYAMTRLVAPGGAEVVAGPMSFMALQAATLGVSILMLTLAGRGLGGTGGYAAVALMMIWLQALRVVAQVGILLLLLAAPALGGIAVLLVSALGVWIAVHFIDEAHALQNLFKSLMVLIVGVVAMAIALSIVLAMAGFSPQGVAGYV